MACFMGNLNKYTWTTNIKLIVHQLPTCLSHPEYEICIVFEV
jgi:hypothetical protein